MTGRITVPAASVIPQGVGAPPPPGLDPKKGKLMCIKVRMLDDTIGVFHLGHKALGSALFDEVCRHLNLLESDYFGLEFLDISGNRCWLDKEKPILRQITSARSDARFYFIVKFYPPNPTDLEEEYTRFLFAAQIKRDLASGQLVVNENTAALMASYIVQSECGDYCVEDYPDHTYLSAVRFIPNQSSEFEKQVMENHKKLSGLGPAESDLQLLEVARRVEFYGIKFHPARDIEGTAVSLCVLHLGIKVYHQLTCANTFSWAKIRKLSFKRKKFLIKLHPDSFAYYKDTIEFIFDNRNESKMFWKKCIEHHSFFRCSRVPDSCSSTGKLPQSKFFNHGSSFRYSGRTHQQLLDYIREHHRRREPFTRPVHSSYSKSEQRYAPKPTIIPCVHQNGNGSLPSGDTAAIYAASTTTRSSSSAAAAAAALNGPTSTTTTASSRDNVASTQRDYDDGGFGDDSNNIVVVGGAAVGYVQSSSVILETERSSSLLQAKPKDFEESTEDQLSSVHDSYRAIDSIIVKESEENVTFIKQLSLYSSNDSARSHDLVMEAVNTMSLSSSRDEEAPPAALKQVSLNGSSSRRLVHKPPPISLEPVEDNVDDDDNFAAGDSQRSNQSLTDFPVAPPFTPSSSMMQSDQEMYYSSDQCASVEKKKKDNFNNQAYQIARELMMIERTYGQDLKLCQDFKSATGKITFDSPAEICSDNLFENLDVIHALQTKFLTEMEQKLSAWETKISPITKMPESQVFRIGDIILREVHNGFQAHDKYISNLYEYYNTILVDFYKKSSEFQSLYYEFETRPQCYIPVAKLMLKPFHRLLSRHGALSKLVLHYIDQGGQNPDLSECKVALDKINSLIKQTAAHKEKLENFTKIIEIEHDFIGTQAAETLFHPGRTLLRQGVLFKVSKGGVWPRLILLFDDLLVQADRTSERQSHLKMAFTLRGVLNLKGLTIEDGRGKSSGDASENADNNNDAFYFTLCCDAGDRSLVFCTNSAEQKRSWMEDISKAIMNAKESAVSIQTFLGFPVSPMNSFSATSATIKSTNSTEESEQSAVSSLTKQQQQQYELLANKTASSLPGSSTVANTSTTADRFWQQKANDSLHVCWHRVVSLTGAHYDGMRSNELSGYLLRKFRNSSGWQKLWVVYCNFCLFFFKSHEDDTPLASLPLLGYHLADFPEPQSNIRKDNVFKLYYKTHFYYFRADCEYSFRRWIECLKYSCNFT